MPVLTGFLRPTRAVGDEVVEDGQVWTRFGYGASYARHVHELHRTRSKYLEMPAMQVGGTAGERLEGAPYR